MPASRSAPPTPPSKKNTLTVIDNRTGKQYEIPIQDNTVRALDLRQIKTGAEDFGLMTYDPAYMNTASCRSAVTYIDGDKGILRYRGYPIEQLAEKCTYLEAAYLLIHGELPNKAQLKEWTKNVLQHTYVHENLKKFMDGFHYDAHPMGMFITTVASLSTFYRSAKNILDPNERRLTIFTSNYQDIPDDTEPNSLLFRIGHRMRSRLHEMCEFVEMDGADYRELPTNGGIDDLVNSTKVLALSIYEVNPLVVNTRPGCVLVTVRGKHASAMITAQSLSTQTDSDGSSFLLIGKWRRGVVRSLYVSDLGMAFNYAVPKEETKEMTEEAVLIQRLPVTKAKN